MASCINRSLCTSKDPATAKKINIIKSYSCNILLGFLVQQLKNKKQKSIKFKRRTHDRIDICPNKKRHFNNHFIFISKIKGNIFVQKRHNALHVVIYD